jgi:hypothetical protein
MTVKSTQQLPGVAKDEPESLLPAIDEDDAIITVRTGRLGAPHGIPSLDESDGSY